MSARKRFAVAGLAMNCLRPDRCNNFPSHLFRQFAIQELPEPAQLEYVVVVRALVRCLIQPIGHCVIPCVLPPFAKSLHAPVRCIEVVELLRLQLVTSVGELSDAFPRRRGEIDPPYVVAFIK